jgi:hypothetical protein
VGGVGGFPAIPATQATDAELAALVGAKPVYAQVTTDQGGITTVVDLTGLAVTITVAEARRVLIRGFIAVQSSVGLDMPVLRVKEGAASLAACVLVLPNTNACQMQVECVVTPSAGAHTYKLTLGLFSGTGPLSTDVLATTPGFILAQDIGPA